MTGTDTSRATTFGTWAAKYRRRRGTYELPKAPAAAEVERTLLPEGWLGCVCLHDLEPAANKPSPGGPDVLVLSTPDGSWRQPEVTTTLAATRG
ncbi:hypothetical protein ABZV93_27395 [Actinopolymorpha sp. NPDC004070]|uniref:hypothetical protein n=1 Tax=Actinopolymorpha sp. NPDC004070 TaxID=3154548 RepID=UPI0033B677BC